jgi:class 3 adenylate cyclase/ABC-type branched-subunit amino acid transport system substrate-binding protein
MSEGPPESRTRAFLFADLRGYTDFVERHGAAAAASLLSRYRALARDAIGRFGGAEIKTEGDSFYVVFSSVSSAVRCGLALTADARTASAEHPDEPIDVGVGIHAGETIELDDGYVGSAVNIAARICGQAGPGEVVVSETVRALTRTLLPVVFKSRGRRELKGIAEPIELFAVVEAAPGSSAFTTAASRRGMSPRRRAALVGGVVLAVAAAAGIAAAGINRWAGATNGLPEGTWTIGLDMPLSGPSADGGVPVRNAVQLAIDEANDASPDDDVEFALQPYDDAGSAGERLPSPARGAENATAMVKDARTIAMIGPYNSDVAVEQIPVTNEAGLLQCSPSTTDPRLTKPEHGALEIRAADPERLNFVRLAPSDDNQIRGLVGYATHELGAESALVIDGNAFVPNTWEDQVAEAFSDLGARVDRMSVPPGTDPKAVLEALRSATDRPDVVVFIGGTLDGAARVRRAMVDAGHEMTPFLGLDFMLDPPDADSGYLRQAGNAAAGTYVSHSSLAPPRASFVDAYRAAYGEEPDEYAAAAYACAEVIIQSLRAVAETGPRAEELREALRAYAVDPAHQYETILGTLGFDTNGDSTQQHVSWFRADPSAGDSGDWVVEKQQDFGAP